MNYSEKDIRNQCKDYLMIRGIFCYHNLQGLGCFPGLSDMCIFYNGVVIMLEFKTEKGKLSVWQERFQVQCLRDGIDYWIIRSLEDLIGRLA